MLNTEGAVPAHDEDDPKYATIGKDLIDRGLAQITERGLLMSLIQATIDQREAHRDTYDDAIVRQMIECVKVHEGGRLTIIFGGGYEIEEQI